MQAAKGVISNCDSLIDLLELIEHFVDHLDIYTRILPTPAMDKIVVKILVELISTLCDPCSSDRRTQAATTE